MANQLIIHSGHPLIGQCRVPGDKSISHRAVIFGSIAEGRTRIRNFLNGHDCFATVNVMRALGVRIDERSATELVVNGVGLDGLQEPEDVLDCANSGTTIRLMTGLLAGQSFASSPPCARWGRASLAARTANWPPSPSRRRSYKPLNTTCPWPAPR
jgi:3-phosphoshikimate 1-carboxyvinyltransferase